MPSLILLGKRTLVGGDDVRCCVSWYGALRFLQCACLLPLIVLTILGNVHNQDRRECHVDSLIANGRFGLLYVYFWCSLVYTVLMFTLLETRIWVVSGWGTPTIPGKRTKALQQILSWKFGLGWPIVVGLAVYGICMWRAAYSYCRAFPPEDKIVEDGGSLDECREHREYCRARLTQTWNHLLNIIVASHIGEALLGGALMASLFTQHVLPILSEHATNNAIINNKKPPNEKDKQQRRSSFYKEHNSTTVCLCCTRQCCIRWMLWCCCSWTSLCLCCVTGKAAEAPTEGDFGTLAALLNDFLGSTEYLDIVLSDIVASLTVLRRLQKQRRLACQQAIQQESNENDNNNNTGINPDQSTNTTAQAEGRQLLPSHQTPTELPDPDAVPEHRRGTLQSTRSVASFIQLQRTNNSNKNDEEAAANHDSTTMANKDNPSNSNDDADPESFDQRYRVSAAIATRVLLEPNNPVDVLAMAEGARFMKLALSIYTWLMQMIQNPVQECWNVFAVGTMCHLAKGKCLPSASSSLNIVGDTPCGWHANSFLHRSGWSETDLVYAQFQGGVAKTPYAIVLDHDWKSVVVVIRGTLSLDDLMADLSVQPESLEAWGEKCGFDGRSSYAHKGILDCAAWVYEDLQQHKVLEKLLLDENARYKDYSLRMVGHSLGAGIASLVGLFLQDQFQQRNLRCSCFCPPGCTLSTDLADGCSDFMTSYVLDSDFVPRLSLQGLEHLRNDIFQIVARIKVSKYKAHSFYPSDLDHEDLREMNQSLLYTSSKDIPDSEYLSQLGKFHEDQAMRRLHRSIEDVPLWPPGKIVYLANAGTNETSSSGGVFARLTNMGGGHTVSYKPLWAKTSDFREVELTSNFLDDHDPENVLRALEGLANEWELSSPYTPPIEVSSAPLPSKFHSSEAHPSQTKSGKSPLARFSLNRFAYNCLPIGTDVKENKGKCWRRRRETFRLLWAAILLSAMVSYLICDNAHHNLVGGSNKILQRNDNGVHWLAVINADYDLVDVRVAENATFSGSSEEQFSGVKVSFCPLNWTTQKEAPSLNPMFSNLVSKSQACDFPFTVELSDVVQRLKESEKTELPVAKMELGGLIFHQSRCGSTWVANMLTRMKPDQFRVYSEPTGPAQIVRAFHEGRINDQQASMLLKHVLFLMSRTNDAREERFFVKLQSTTTRHLSLFREVFPATPWMFLYRDSVQVMMSYLKEKNYRLAFCQGGAVRGLPPIRNPPDYIQRIVDRRAPSNYSLTYEGYCAANIASVTDPVVDQHGDRGFVVNYDSLPEALYERWKSVWDISIGPDEMERMQHVSKEYSKGRGQRKRQYKDDTQKKISGAGPEVKEAAGSFLQGSFLRLEERAQMEYQS